MYGNGKPTGKTRNSETAGIYTWAQTSKYCTTLANKTRTSKVGAISKAQKAAKLLKLEIFEIFFFRKMSHSAEKYERGTLWDLLTYIQLQNIKKLEGGPFGDIKKFSKSRTVPKKSKGGTLEARPVL